MENFSGKDVFCLNDNIKLSLAVPCFNEQENVKPFCEAVINVFEKTDISFQIVFVNDGSRDRTLERLEEIYEMHKDIVKVISFSRNFGKEAAVYAALSHCDGELTAIIDADLQQRPEIVLEMVRYLDDNQNCDCVAAYQKDRNESGFMKLCKKVFYSFINKLSETELYPDASDFRTFRKNVRDAVLEMTEYSRFSKGIFSWIGFETYFMPYKAEERHSGETKWGFRKLLSYAMGGILSFTVAPLRIPVYVGGFMSVTGIIWIIVMSVLCDLYGIGNIYSLLLVISVIYLLSGVGFVFTGIVGEYISSVYMQGKNRPVYIIKKMLGEKENND